MGGTEETNRVYLPRLGALWDSYNMNSTEYLKARWIDFKGQIEMKRDPIIGWFHLLVLTDLLKMRNEFNHTDA